MLKILTAEQKKLKNIVKKEYLEFLDNPSQQIDKNLLKRGIDFIYKLLKLPAPNIIISNDPLKAVQRMKKTCKTISTIHSFGKGFDSGWCSFYDYFHRIGVINNPKFLSYLNLLKCGAFAYIFTDKTVVAITQPLFIKRKDKKLHCETGPSIEWGGGFKLFHLNGVAVPEWLVMTHSDALDPQRVLQIKNVDQRAEGIRKLGIERLSKFGKLIDTYKNYDDEWFHNSKYELIDMSPIFKNITYAPYLKMLNQSVPGVWHMEAVSKDCKSLKEAIEFRTKSKDPKIQNIK